MRVLLLLLISLPGFSQIHVQSGFISNFTPETSWGFNIGASYDIPKTGDRIGYTVMTHDYRSYYIPYYGAKLGKQTRFLGGVNFINDYTGKDRILSKSYMVGFNYDFNKPYKDEPLGFYTGFMYTNEYFLIRAGMDLGMWTGYFRKKRK